MKTIPERNNHKTMVGPHNESTLPPKNYTWGKNGGEEDKGKTENDVTGLNDEGGL